MTRLSRSPRPRKIPSPSRRGRSFTTPISTGRRVPGAVFAPWGSIRALAQYLGVSETTLSAWISLKWYPSLDRSYWRGKRLTRWPEIERKLVEVTGKTMKQLWPGFVRASGLFDVPKVRLETREVTSGTLLNMIDQKTTPRLLHKQEEIVLERAAIEQALRRLHPREREVIKLRYGLGENEGMCYTLEEVGRIFKVTAGRIREIQMRAKRKMHRMAILQDLMPPDEE